MDDLQYKSMAPESVFLNEKVKVLNLIINGWPSILQKELSEKKSLKEF